jgi:2-polyprenyl-6-methoxyphenol hydroxylase-like FAD-dependent oxidoreductase
MAACNVLISGAGIAGPTLAYWLHRAGFKPTIVEHAPSLRTGGYAIDFWGLGYDIAEDMGLAGDLERLGYHIRELRIVGGDGRRSTGFGTNIFAELTGGRYVTIRRSDLSRLLLDRARPTTDVRFGETIEALTEDADGVVVTFAHAPVQRFDLVIGADGLHSQVRQLAFGPQEHFEISLGYVVAAFEASGYRPRDQEVYLMHNEPGRMLGRLALRNDRTLFLFVFSDPPAQLHWPHDLAAQKAVLRQRYSGGGWETSRILDALDAADDLYLDRVSQIHMPLWSRGRIALVGDAASCVSLTAGQGSALAMTAAYALAGELGRPGASHSDAFARYESLLRPYIATKQKVAKSISPGFAPLTSLGIAFRNLVISATAIPGVARYTFGRDLVDKLALPNYDWRCFSDA